MPIGKIDGHSEAKSLETKVTSENQDFQTKGVLRGMTLAPSDAQSELSEIVNTAPKGSSSESASNLVEMQRVQKDSSKQSVFAYTSLKNFASLY